MTWAGLLEEKSSLAIAIDLVGERWALLLLSGCFVGVSRFNQFERYLGINRNLLSSRLEKLVKAGLLTKHLYSEHPKRYEYRLTDIAEELRPIIIGLATWAERNFTRADAPFSLLHRQCEHSVEMVVYCKTCDEHVPNRDIVNSLNEGAGPESTRLFNEMVPAVKIQ